METSSGTSDFVLRNESATKGAMETRKPLCRRAQMADLEVVVAALADAFQDEPTFSYIVPGAEARRKALPHAFRIIVGEDIKAGRVMMTANGEAATAWRVPGLIHETWLEELRNVLPFVRIFGTATLRALKISNLIKAHLPGEDCWYLHMAGCRSGHQGKGFGGAAIRAGLAFADAERRKTYLETADPKNLPIYRALGFEIVHTWKVPGGPQFWGMMRAAR
jgi:GNAT superfamily N-acetyltransferase